jgi:hypothetical protein
VQQPRDEVPDDSTGDSEGMFDPDGALSRRYLLEREYCCELGCKNCPYGFTSHRPAEPA